MHLCSFSASMKAPNCVLTTLSMRSVNSHTLTVSQGPVTHTIKEHLHFQDPRSIQVGTILHTVQHACTAAQQLQPPPSPPGRASCTCLGPSLKILWITKQAFQHTTDTCLRGNLATTRHTVFALFSRQVAMTTSSMGQGRMCTVYTHTATKETTWHYTEFSLGLRPWPNTHGGLHCTSAWAQKDLSSGQLAIGCVGTPLNSALQITIHTHSSQY